LPFPKTSSLRIALKELMRVSLTLSLELFPLDIGDEEGGNEIFDKGFWLISSFFDLIQEVVECLHLKLSLFVSLKG
jgi:hypothetical protein